MAAAYACRGQWHQFAYTILACTSTGEQHTSCSRDMPHARQSMDLFHIVDGKALDWQQARMH